MTLEELDKLPGNTSSERLWREIAVQLAQANVYLKQLIELHPMQFTVEHIKAESIDAGIQKAISKRTPLTKVE